MEKLCYTKMSNLIVRVGGCFPFAPCRSRREVTAMDVLVDLLLTLAKAIITQFVAYLFSKIPNKKSKKKTTRKKTPQSRVVPKRNK